MTLEHEEFNGEECPYCREDTLRIVIDRISGGTTEHQECQNPLCDFNVVYEVENEKDSEDACNS